MALVVIKCIILSFFPVGKSHEADLVKEALHRETQALLSGLNQIKELLSSSEIRMKIRKELFEDRHNS